MKIRITKKQAQLLLQNVPKGKTIKVRGDVMNNIYNIKPNQNN